MTEDDLESYEPKWREPLVGWFRGLEVVTVPPPSSGGLVLLQALSILDGFPLDEEKSDLSSGNLDSGEGQIRLAGRLNLDGVDVRCVADVNLAEMAGTGRLEILDAEAPN